MSLSTADIDPTLLSTTTPCVATTYHASPWEQWWRENIAAIGKHWEGGRGCRELCMGPCTYDQVTRNSSNNLAAWLNVRRQRDNSSWSDASESEHDGWPRSVMSYHRMADSCTRKVSIVPIEPLAGFLRHPFHVCVKKMSMVASKEYLLPAWRYELLPAPPRTFFFDCGASLYNKGSGGASQRWFVDSYAKRGLAFERILAWEFTNHTDKEIRQHLPPDLLSHTSIYRDPAEAAAGCCTADRLSYFNFGIDGQPGSVRNPLVHLRALARPEDFVVFKLDVDSPSIELAIIEQLVADRSTASLIDDFYWEHVVKNTPMDHFGWGHDLRRMPISQHQTLADSYSYFGRLRSMGVRAHSWV